MSLNFLDFSRRELRDEYLRRTDAPWIIGYSGGKDSTLVTQLVFEMLLSLPRSDRKRAVHVVGNDTLVESPLLAAHFGASIAKIAEAAESLRLPVTCTVTTPKPEQTFWVNVIGRGYRPPSRIFRWCTERLKIDPTSGHIRRLVSVAGRSILLLGVRSDESKARAESIAKHGQERLNQHSDLKGCLVFRPISHWTTDEVWGYLLQNPAPWGGRHRNLVTLYKNANGECPLVLDKSAAAGCGTSSSRFGCWTCTVVDKDKSGESLADAGHAGYDELLEFRDWLKTLPENLENRQLERRNGKVEFLDDGRVMRGPFTLTVREEILNRLLAMQARTTMSLISEDEILLIKRIWAEDCITAVQRRLPILETP